MTADAGARIEQEASLPAKALDEIGRFRGVSCNEHCELTVDRPPSGTPILLKAFRTPLGRALDSKDPECTAMAGSGSGSGLAGG